jgi:hypothetical protein
MTSHFLSYAANFNRIRLLEMIDYREPQSRLDELRQRLIADIARERGRYARLSPETSALNEEMTGVIESFS